ncbi:hypothetical protein, unlikely [Trypanosoma brucei gambiense DAL972]|uniref:Uncharacterized protein n=1 Tax=Trypanosoma brucei gambiense (strain MHOM/CI/86/DAL972) TaxID=679716 RepID=D0A507_TRYB9|nr:hypothetical protein, unlikely [Trypanosoma brucei gambiense DAL972]CBH16351.1 hypothetical protein, unlikely [Trypanosoma brucei gambiense DAL972]|eukprot:XP_011778615.1 hypothetical protein, unlikely [Trypanosoma brucei gambiense DAL972]
MSHFPFNFSLGSLLFPLFVFFFFFFTFPCLLYFYLFFFLKPSFFVYTLTFLPTFAFSTASSAYLIIDPLSQSRDEKKKGKKNPLTIFHICVWKKKQIVHGRLLSFAL